MADKIEPWDLPIGTRAQIVDDWQQTRNAVLIGIYIHPSRTVYDLTWEFYRPTDPLYDHVQQDRKPIEGVSDISMWVMAAEHTIERCEMSVTIFSTTPIPHELEQV